MKAKEAVACLAALGHLNRLQVFQLLVKAGAEGMSIGELQRTLEVPASTLSFHLKELATVKLVEQSKEGRTVTCRANYKMLNDVLVFLKQDCCKGVALPVFCSR
jgi:ArsR family transcriptional regulator, arsenate/arsenite/antimonite-responsive transcriptional repressor